MKKLILACLSLSFVLNAKLVDTGSHDYCRQESRVFFEYPNDDPRLFLLSSQTSGSHFLMYIIQYFTHQVWQSSHKKYAFFNQCRDDEKNFYRAHQVEGTTLFNEPHGYYFPFEKEKDSLIFLIRSLKELVYKSNAEAINKAVNSASPYERLKTIFLRYKLPLHQCNGSYIDQYFKNINLYRSWPEKRRVLVRFSDLMKNNLEPVIRSIDSIHPIYNLEKLTIFDKNLKAHRNRCVKLTRALNWTPCRSVINYDYKETETYKKYSELLDQIIEEFYPEHFDFLVEENLL
ncbi:MAG: hypothetical protein WDZ28_01300 [Simkaniaceae bacterium]